VSNKIKTKNKKAQHIKIAADSNQSAAIFFYYIGKLRLNDPYIEAFGNRRLICRLQSHRQDLTRI
jgi:hypothetical protein